jgi:hypothetical protein
LFECGHDGIPVKGTDCLKVFVAANRTDSTAR